MATFELSSTDTRLPTSGVNDIGNNTEKTNEENNTAPEQKQVTVEGPLSTIYTAALNACYAQELLSICKEGTASDQELLAEVAMADKVRESDLYIYSTDEDNIEQDGPINVFNKLHLALGKEGRKVAVIEMNGSKMSKAAITLESYLSSNGVKVYLSRKAAVDGIYHMLRGK